MTSFNSTGPAKWIIYNINDFNGHNNFNSDLETRNVLTWFTSETNATLPIQNVFGRTNSKLLKALAMTHGLWSMAYYYDNTTFEFTFKFSFENDFDAMTFTLMMT